MKIIERNAVRCIAALLVIFIFILLRVPSHSDLYTSTDESIEVVITIPVETELRNAGTANAADTWCRMIKSAKKTIDIAQFYLSNKKKEPLEPVIAEILAAADRGVRVRFLVGRPVNDSMAKRTTEVKDLLENHKNISFTTFDWKTLTGGILHAKYFIIDESDVFVGSQNFDWRSLKHIHETGLKIRSKAIAMALTRIFEADWQYNRGDRSAYLKLKKTKSLSFSPEIQLAASPEIANPPWINAAIETLIRLINGAKKSITVQLLDYHVNINKSPEKFLGIDYALRRAAGRGVSVKMIVADWNKRNPGVNGLKGLTGVHGIKVKFATIPGFSEGFIPYARVVHSKVMRIDETISWVGTSNWGHHYFYSSRNIEVITRNRKVATLLDRLFIELWNSKYTYPVEPNKRYKPPRIFQ